MGDEEPDEVTKMAILSEVPRKRCQFNRSFRPVLPGHPRAHPPDRGQSSPQAPSPQPQPQAEGLRRRRQRYVIVIEPNKKRPRAIATSLLLYLRLNSSFCNECRSTR